MTKKEIIQGSREYDEQLLRERYEFVYDSPHNFVYDESYAKQDDKRFLDNRYNSDLLKEKEQLEKRLAEINEELK